MIKIIGGVNKGLKIDVPVKGVRPTSAKKRETIFSILDSYEIKNNKNIYKKKNVLDLFSGSGAFGLEAISRGATFSFFYENNYETVKYLKKNCIKVCNKKNFLINQDNIINNNFKKIKKRISLVFIDPPYKMNPFENILKKLFESKILLKNSIIIIECSSNLELKIPSFLSFIKKKEYRNTNIFFLTLI